MSEVENEIEKIRNMDRMLLEIKLVPRQGDRFQPTGFPEIGAATYENPEGKKMLIIESEQSMANHMESSIIKENTPDIIDDFEGLSYIKVHLTSKDGIKSETSSLTEAHRINSPYITSNKDFVKDLIEKSNYKEGVFPDWEKIGETLFYYDINSLIHGVFMSNIGGRFRVPRALSAFIDGEDVKEAPYAGTKLSNIDPVGKYKVEGKGSVTKKTAYSNVPYPKMSYTAKQIKAYFNLDISLLKSYNLSKDATNLLIALSLFKIRGTLENKLKLRTACDFKVYNTNELDESGLPKRENLIEYIKQLIQKNKNNMKVTELNVNLIDNKNKNKDTKNKKNNDE